MRRMPSPVAYAHKADVYTVQATCVECREVHRADVTGPELRKLFDLRTPAQQAVPDMPPAQRELFFVSGTCGRCWDAMFGEAS